MDQTLGEIRSHQKRRARASGRLPKDGDAARIATERRDVAADPTERGDLIQQAIVAGAAVGGLG